MKSWMNLRAIEIFVAVVEDEGLTAAGRRLNLTQSAVSQAITSLEEAIGQKLIDRTVRPARPTLFGSDFFHKAVDLIERAHELEQVTDLAMGKTLPLLRIGIVDSFAATAGPFLVQELSSIAARWTVSSSANDTGTRALLERRVDFLITSDESKRETSLVWRPIFEEPFIIVAPKSLSASASSVRTLLRAGELIRYGEASFLDQQTEIYFREHSLRPQEKYRLDTSDAILAMVCAGIGWAITTPLCALKSLPPDADVIFRQLRPSMKRRLFLVSRDNEVGSLGEHIAAAARRSVEKHCIPAINKMAPWLLNGDQPADPE